MPTHPAPDADRPVQPATSAEPPTGLTSRRQPIALGRPPADPEGRAAWVRDFADAIEASLARYGRQGANDRDTHDRVDTGFSRGRSRTADNHDVTQDRPERP